MEVCVVGAGVLGLSTAVRLQRTLRAAVRVTLLADRFSPQTTSDVAAGFWEPYMLGPDDDPDQLRRWGEETLQHMVALATSEQGPEAGSILLSGYTVHTSKPQVPSWKDSVFGFREMTTSELALYPNHRYGFHYTAAMTECVRYLPWLLKQFKANGGVVVRKRLFSLAEVPPQFSVLVLCCGLGASSLVGDRLLTPIRGQVIRVKAPWIKNFVMDDENDIYIIPGRDAVVLGGTHESGEWDTNPSEKTRSRILKGAVRLLPSLKSCDIIDDYVGLRPTRSKVRLAKEVIHCGSNRTLRVVYNYGHGGAGITLHWGCAAAAVKLVKDFITEMNSAKL